MNKIAFGNETMRKRPAVLRKLVVDKISNVPKGANPGARVVLRKRDTGSDMNAAVSALDYSIKSIVADATVDKRAMIAESLSHFKAHCLKSGIDAENADERAAEIVKSAALALNPAV